MFVAVDQHQHFQSFISETTSIMHEYSFSNAEKSFGSYFKIADYFFNLGYVFICVMTFGSSTSS